jgi:cytochrome c556
VRGESIAPPSSVEPKNEWGKIANLAPLMSRLEMAQQNRIAPATSNAGDFKKNSPQLVHEAEIVAALGEAIARPGMDNADDEKFRGYARALQKSALDLRQAVNDSNYDAARAAAGVMKKTCDSCHGDFR